MQRQSIEHHTKKQFKVKNTNIKNLQKERVIFSKRLDRFIGKFFHTTVPFTSQCKLQAKLSVQPPFVQA